MTYSRLGASGLAVSAIGLGCNNFGRIGSATADQAGVAAVVHAALDAGITLFDTADIYGAEPGTSERFLGAALRGRRDDAVVATKFGMDMRGANGDDFGARGSRRYIRRAVEASLRRLDTDWIDLYQLHEPDPATPIGETLSALDDLVREGKVRYLGHSNLAGWQIADADWVAATSGTSAFISAQNHYSLLRRAAETEVLAAADAFGLGVLPYYPLSNGLLTGKYTRDHAPAGSRLAVHKAHLLDSAPWDELEALAAFAAARDITMLDIAFGWLLGQPAVTSVIAGATTPQQVAANAAISWRPTDEDLRQIDAIIPPGTDISDQ